MKMKNNATSEELDNKIDLLSTHMLWIILIGIGVTLLEVILFKVPMIVTLITSAIFAIVGLLIEILALKDIVLSLARKEDAEKTIIIDLAVIIVLIFASMTALADFINSRSLTSLSTLLVSLATLWQTWHQLASKDWGEYMEGDRCTNKKKE